MDDTLLTIDAATQAFRVSPKTIRRRLAASEIEGAYKRPSDRGVEWVFPRSSLERLGYVTRDVTGEVEGADPVEFWRARAHRAEATLAAARADDPDARRSVRGLRTGFLVATVLLGVLVVAALLAFGGSDSDEPDDEPVAVLLRALTDPGDDVGVVGTASLGYLPADRIPTVIADDEVASATPRFVIATSQDAPGVTLAGLQASAELVLALEQPAGQVLVFDRRGTALATPEPATPEQDPDDGEATTPTSEPPAEDVASPPAPDPDDETDVDLPPSALDDPATETGGRTEVRIEAGDNFWDLAEARMASALERPPTDAEILPYWQQVIDANADDLVQPGNPDLILVGQVLILPPLPAGP